MLQAPYRGIREMSEAPSEVYCSYFLPGSPASYYGVKSSRFVTKVGTSEVTSLDDVAAAVQDLADGASVQLRLVDLQGQASSATLKVDYHYWPTGAFVRDKASNLWARGPVL